MFKNCKISEEGHSLLRLVEVLGYLARLERVHRAEDDEDHVVEEGHDDREGRNLGRMVFRLFIKFQRMKYCVLIKIGYYENLNSNSIGFFRFFPCLSCSVYFIFKWASNLVLHAAF